MWHSRGGRRKDSMTLALGCRVDFFGAFLGTVFLSTFSWGVDLFGSFKSNVL